MTILLTMAALVIATISSVHGAPYEQEQQLCRLTTHSVLFAPLRHPEDAPTKEWVASIRTFNGIARSCPNGPSDPESRQLLFDYIDQKLSLDYDHLCAIWTKGHDDTGDGCIDHDEHNDLRAYLDQIVDPSRDIGRMSMILKHGNGLAISKLGLAAKSRVVDMASGPQPVEAFHDPQIEALRALGYWLLPNESRFTPDDKAQFTMLLLHALPPADKVAGGRETVMARAILQALGNSSRPDVAQALRNWAQLNQASRNYASPLAVSATTAAVAVEKRVQQDR
jgi:hypothetical protein